jgi:iron complex outermembrane receptor protein
MSKTLLFASAAVSLAVAGPVLAEEAPDRTVSELLVTAAPYAISMDSATTSVDVLNREDLEAGPPGGLGDALAGLPGIRSTFFGPGASRPVIRGLSGPRVLVLTNGLGAIDASALSPDHQVATDPQEAERIEVLRGPSALAYGGSAIGGVVNIIDDRIAAQPLEGFKGRISGEAGSVDDSQAVAGALRFGAGGWVFSVDGAHRESEDYKAPVPAESRRLMESEGEEYPGDIEGEVENTAVELSAYGAGLSYVGERGRIGLSVKRTETTYGVPGHAHEHEEEAPEGEGEEHGEEAVAIDLEQTRYDLQGELAQAFGPFETVRFSVGYADYEHVELEGDEVGTRFLSDGWEGRLELIQPDRDGWQGAVGVQGLRRDFDAIGEEALVPRTRISEVGVFTLQRFDRDAWGVEGGLRVDTRKLDSVVGERDFTNVSASVGGFLRPAEGWFLGLSVARTSRAPTEEELFSDGAHAATRAYEIGDATLDQEVAWSIDATVHYDAGAWTSDLHAFAVSYDGFIDLRPTGLEDAETELPIFVYRQTDATFWGLEAEAAYELWRSGDRAFSLEGAADYVRGDTDLGAPARIPPWSVTGRAVYDGGWWDGKVEVRHVAEQDRVAQFELPTDDYTMVNASVSFRPLPDQDLRLFLDARNLTDVEAREHASVLKDLAPLPGRNVRFGIGYSF